VTPTAPSIPNILRQAVYLGMSWTWCIGMFLPVLLIRDYGHYAWWVFAIPNIVGAAAMGWVIRSPEHSVSFLQNHQIAVRAFSVVTMAFQLFFVFWMVPQLSGSTGMFAFIGACVVCLFTTRGNLAPMTCSLVLVVSTIAWLASAHNLSYPPLSPPTISILWLSLSCLAGFLTCPYLDATFHQARQNCHTPTESKWAFALGFGLFFASMIVFTLLYATNLTTNTTLARLVGIHMAVQAALTFALHAYAESTLTPPSRLWPGTFPAVAIAIAVLVGNQSTAAFLHLPPGETTYRLFMSFYALVFPAYIIIHLRAGQRKHWVLLLATLALAGPMFYAAFIAGKMVWLLPGTATLLVAYIAADVIRQRSPSRPPPPPHSAPQ
jgi:hypothetical protein